MTSPQPAGPVLLIVAVFSRHDEVLAWVAERLTQQFGPISLSSLTYAFSQTAYYQSAMGCGLRKRLLAFHNLVPADCLAPVKRATIALEHELATSQRFPEARPLNLDPGVLSLGKFSLATTKDQQHRIYLRDGIYAEVTLRFQEGTYMAWPWTYADYQLPEVIGFLNAARRLYRERLRDQDSRIE